MMKVLWEIYMTVHLMLYGMAINIKNSGSNYERIGKILTAVIIAFVTILQE